jgi:hypothetical protein
MYVIDPRTIAAAPRFASRDPQYFAELLAQYGDEAGFAFVAACLYTDQTR